LADTEDNLIQLTIADISKATFNNVLAGYYIKACVRYSVSKNLLTVLDYEYRHSNIVVIYHEVYTKQPASTADGLLVYNALESCLQKITQRQATLSSSFFALNGCGYQNIITNGWQLRKFDRPLMASWTDLMESLGAIFGIGYGIESGVVKVEAWEYFYANSELIDLGEVGDYEEQICGELIFNHIKLGFNYYADDENLSQTIEDFHTESEWSTPIKNHRGLFEKKSDLILSPFLIESTRRVQYIENPTESFKWDDNLFMIAIQDYYDTATADFIAERNENMTVTGITSPETTFNIRYTIKRMLLNWGVWINSFAMRYYDTASKIVNLFFKNNGDLITQFNSNEACLLGDLDRDLLEEDAVITKGDIQRGEAIFDQKYILFKKKLTDSQLKIIKDSHQGIPTTDGTYNLTNYGYIKLRDYDGQIVTGWLMEMTYNIYDQVADFKLIKRYPAGYVIVGGEEEEDIIVLCLPDFGNDSIVAGDIITQRISLAEGLLSSITIYKYDTGTESVKIWVAKIGWDGVPDTGDKIYEESVSIKYGENIINFNLAIPETNLYCLALEHNGYDLTLTTVRQLDGILPICHTDYLHGVQYYLSGAWAGVDDVELFKFTYSSVPLLSRNKVLFISSYTYDDTTFITDKDTYVRIFQQVRFLSDVIIKKVQVYTTYQGSPTEDMICRVTYPDTDGLPSAIKVNGISNTILPTSGGVTEFTFTNLTVSAGLYCITIGAGNVATGVLNSTNYYKYRSTDDTRVYQFGVPGRQTNAFVWSKLTNRRLMIKVIYELV